MGVDYYFYADNTQFCLSFDTPDEEAAAETVRKCAQTVRKWMMTNDLKMNDEKTEVMFIGNSKILSRLQRENICVGDKIISPKSTVKSLGVTLNEEMKLVNHVSNQCRTAYIHLRSLSRIKPYLMAESLQTLVHAFITSKLDYCNSLYLGSPNYVIDRLQSVQNSAARLITGSKKNEHITPILYDLHWLPVHQRIKFKVLLILFKSKHHMCPSYITSLFSDYHPSRDLRSSNSELLHIPFSRSSYIRETSLSHAGPRMWNQLPSDLRSCDNIDIFKRKLKTYLFNEHFI